MANQKFAVMGVIIALLFAFIILSSIWVSKQEQTVKTNPVFEQTVKEKPVTPKTSSQAQIPVIDPNNDPLAPMVKEEAPAIKETSKTPKASPEPVHEFSLDSPIMAQ